MKEEKGMSRIDKIVENAGEKLASSYTRRSFLGKVAGVAGAAMFGGAVILGEVERAEAIAAGCFGTTDAQVCYDTYRVTISWGAYLNKGPSQYSPYVYGTSSSLPCYNQPVLMNQWDYFGAQSCRSTASAGCNPTCSRSQVVASDGIRWIWGYHHNTSKSGWAPVWHPNGTVWMQWQQHTGPASCGPAGADFDCRDNYPGWTDAQKRVHCPGYNGCTGQGPGTVTDSGAYWSIRDAGSNLANSDQQFYMRYAPNSVPIGWMLPGDKIKRLSYKTGWSCIYCYCNPQTMPYGCRGWIDSSALGSPGTYSSCGGPPTSACPGGSYYP